MRTKKKKNHSAREKNRNSQKSVKSVRLMGVGVYGGKVMLHEVMRERSQSWHVIGSTVDLIVCPPRQLLSAGEYFVDL